MKAQQASLLLLGLGVAATVLLLRNGVPRAPGGLILPGQDVQLSPHFKLSQLVRSQTALVRGIDNAPTPAALANLRRVAATILEPLHRVYGQVGISSAYRNAAVNAAVGGAPNSNHMKGLAVDVSLPGYHKALSKGGKYQFLKMLRGMSTLEFSKAIAYGDTGHIHLTAGTGKRLLWTERKGGPAVAFT